jgi:hypothetical protein
MTISRSVVQPTSRRFAGGGSARDFVDCWHRTTFRRLTASGSDRDLAGVHEDSRVRPSPLSRGSRLAAHTQVSFRLNTAKGPNVLSASSEPKLTCDDRREVRRNTWNKAIPATQPTTARPLVGTGWPAHLVDDHRLRKDRHVVARAWLLTQRDIPGAFRRQTGRSPFEPSKS